MRPLCVVTLILALFAPRAARSGGPDPGMSFCVLSAPDFPCHYISRADGGADVLTVTATILDVGGLPVPFVPASCTLLAKGGTINFCTCCANPQLGITDPGGEVVFTFSAFGGRGTLDLLVEAAGVVTCVETIAFTSSDLNGSCNPLPASATNVVDLGIWAGGALAPPVEAWADYNCTGAFEIVDLGIFALGLSDGCGLVCP